MFIRFQENPLGKSVGDCSVRAISNVLEMSWEQTYIELCLQGFIMADMPSSNSVIDAYLRSKGFRKSIIPNTCPDCYTVADFADDHQQGVYLLATGEHVVSVVDGAYYDSWDSGNEIPIYYYRKG